MPPPPRDDSPFCPHCAALRISTASSSCWRCNKLLPAMPGPLPNGTNAARHSLIPPPYKNGAAVVLGIAYFGQLLLAVAFISQAPFWLPFAVVFTLPALWRTFRLARRREAARLPLSPKEWLLALVAYQGITAAFLALLGSPFCCLAAGMWFRLGW